MIDLKNYDQLRNFIKQEIKDVSLNQLYELSFQFNDESKYLPSKYKSEYEELIAKDIVKKFKDLKNDNKTYEGKLKSNDIENITQLLTKNKDNPTQHILDILVIYSTYFLKKPVHNLKTTFPGKKRIYKKGNDYYCPVKKYHINNNEAVCKYCIAKKIEE